tara:strand:- start:2997 stop:3344 length:348 start_codon:yes stop_codon:yes gene_type:complete
MKRVYAVKSRNQDGTEQNELGVYSSFKRAHSVAKACMLYVSGTADYAYQQVQFDDHRGDACWVGKLPDEPYNYIAVEVRALDEDPDYAVRHEATGKTLIVYPANPYITKVYDLTR